MALLVVMGNQEEWVQGDEKGGEVEREVEDILHGGNGDDKDK